jgi:hypothetical protein
MQALNVIEAANYTGLSRSFLNKRRVYGGGPLYSRTANVSFMTSSTLMPGCRTRRSPTPHKQSKPQRNSKATTPISVVAFSRCDIGSFGIEVMASH